MAARSLRSRPTKHFAFDFGIDIDAQVNQKIEESMKQMEEAKAKLELWRARKVVQTAAQEPAKEDSSPEETTKAEDEDVLLVEEPLN